MSADAAISCGQSVECAAENTWSESDSGLSSGFCR